MARLTDKQAIALAKKYGLKLCFGIKLVVEQNGMIEAQAIQWGVVGCVTWRDAVAKAVAVIKARPPETKVSDFKRMFKHKEKLAASWLIDD